MFNQSEEGIEKDLMISGKVKKFKIDKLILPHMGWNELKNLKNDYLFNNIKNIHFIFYIHILLSQMIKRISMLITIICKTFRLRKNNVYGVHSTLKKVMI